MSGNTFTTVDDYIESFPVATQEVLKKVRETIKKVAPDSVTETISYEIPTFKLNGKYLVYFAGWKEHIAIYPIPPGDDKFQKAIAPYRSGKGTLKFPLSQPIPYGLIEQVVQAHLKARS